MPALPGYTIKTYRYLRLAMLTMLVMLAAGVLIERAHNAAGCFQPSISDYYYTPAQAVFVASLITIGVCMIALKGSTEWEDSCSTWAACSRRSSRSCRLRQVPPAPRWRTSRRTSPRMSRTHPCALRRWCGRRGHDPRPRQGRPGMPSRATGTTGTRSGWWSRSRSWFGGFAWFLWGARELSGVDHRTTRATIPPNNGKAAA